jgi:hypothetical protein
MPISNAYLAAKFLSDESATFAAGHADLLLDEGDLDGSDAESGRLSRSCCEDRERARR